MKKIKSISKINKILLIFVLIIILLFTIISTNPLYLKKVAKVLKNKTFSYLQINPRVAVSDLNELNKFIRGSIKGSFSKNRYPNLDLMISQENIMKIWNNEGKNKYYPIKINIVDISNGRLLAGKARSKGDRHLHKEDILSQSYRVNLKGDNRFLGLEEFSIQRPIIRGFTWELLIAEIFNSQNLVTLKTYPINFSVNGDNRGIYFIEEVPSKITLERNKRKNGPIFGLEEKFGTGLDAILDTYDFKFWKDSDIYTQSKNILLEQFALAREGKVIDDNFFDMEEWAKYFALSDIFGSYHGTIIKSVKFYYNPVIGKFQPILFDAHKGAGSFDEFILSDFIFIGDKAKCEYICKRSNFYKSFLLNENFFELYTNFLDIYSSAEFMNEIESLYNEKFITLDNEFYSRFVLADNVFFRSWGFYFLNLDDVLVKRNELIKNKIKKIKQNKKFVNFINKNKENHSSKYEESINILNIEDFNFVGSQLQFDNPIILNLSGNTLLEGTSSNKPLIITGPVMIIQNEGNVKIENVTFLNPANYLIPNRNISGSINFIDSNIKINNLVISNSVSEDAINIINSDFDISKLKIENSKSDALDLDFSDGHISTLICQNIGNDCLDTSESNVSIDFINAFIVGDKGVSAGENSILDLDKFTGVQVEIGVASKDGSLLKINDFLIEDSNLPVTSYIKKPDYAAPKIEIIKHNLSSKTNKVTAILGSEVIYNLPESFDVVIKSSYDIEKSLYGVDFGKATKK